MAGEAEQLVISLEARIREFERNFQRARRTANDNFTGIENRARRAGRNLETTMADSTSRMSRSLDNFGTAAATRLKGAFAAISAGVALNEVRKTVDEYAKIMNGLKVAGVKDGELSGTFDQLFAAAQRNSVPLDALATLYGRVSQAQTTLKASSQEVMRVTDIVAQSLRVAGKSASESSGALLQLSQAFSNGKVQAEEYNSLLDGAYPLLQAAAAGMKEAGGDVAKLTALVKDGKVSSEAFFRAIMAGAPLLEEKLAGAADTSEQAIVRLKNETIRLAGELDKATGISSAFAGGINMAANAVGALASAIPNAIEMVSKLIGAMGQLRAASQGAFYSPKTQEDFAALKARAGEIRGEIDGINSRLHPSRRGEFNANVDRLQRELGDIENRLSSADAKTLPKAADAEKPAPTGKLGSATSTSAKIAPISLTDYAVPGESKGGRGGGGASSTDKLNRYERELETVQRRTEALRLEAEMVGKGRMETEKAKIALQLEQAAKRENITVTDQMRTAIDAAATGYANAKLRAEDLKEAFEGVKDAAKYFGDQITDGLADMIIEGKSATEVIQSLGKALLKAALQGALMGSGPFGKLFGGGIFGALFGGFAEGGYTGDGGKYQPAGIVHRGEYVVSKAATQRIGVGNLDRMHRGALRGYADGGFVGAAPVIRQPELASISAAPVQNISVNSTVTVNAQGSTGDARKDAAYGDQIAKRVSQELRSLVGSEIAKQLRPGGIIREAGR